MERYVQIMWISKTQQQIRKNAFTESDTIWNFQSIKLKPPLCLSECTEKINNHHHCLLWKD